MKGEKLYEIKKYLFVTVKSILCLLDELIFNMRQEHAQCVSYINDR